MDAKVPEGSVPRFVVFAMKDKTNLAEIQLVQAVVVGGKAEHKVVKYASTNPSGEVSLCHAFDVSGTFRASSPSYWYARVLEVPSPRWSHYDCKASPAECGGNDVNIQERAWTSPIWHLPL